MPLDRPIFIVGTGRCGSTIIHEVFTQHPRVAFLSGLCVLYPQQPQYNRWAMHLMDIPLLHRIPRRMFRPAEHWPFWEEHCRGFSAPFRDLRAGDVRPNQRARLTRLLQQMTTTRRNRLLVKLTGWPRISFLSEIFRDALFIHVIRDGRAVANSLLNVDFWLGYRGPRQWQWGDLSPEHQATWERHGHSFVALAGIQWNILMDSFETFRNGRPSSRYLEVKYEDFAAEPQAVFGEILAFCGLDYPQKFRSAIGDFEIENANFKWKEQLTGPQRRELEEVMAERLVRWGYSLDVAQVPDVDSAHLLQQHRRSTGIDSFSNVGDAAMPPVMG